MDKERMTAQENAAANDQVTWSVTENGVSYEKTVNGNEDVYGANTRVELNLTPASFFIDSDGTYEYENAMELFLFPVSTQGEPLSDLRRGFYIKSNGGFKAGELDKDYSFINYDPSNGLWVVGKTELHGEVLLSGLGQTEGYVGKPLTVRSGDGKVIPADTGWKTATLASEFVVYNGSEGNAPQYRKIGGIVEIRAIVSPKTAIPGSTTGHTIFTLPSGYRPNKARYYVCQGSQKYTWLLCVNTNGTVTFARYGSGDGNITCPTNAWLNFNACFMAD
ncbi:hypothetical protein [Ruminococcus gauvreauii]|uniref:hypothetical protein n=1 Tax=Ruminococcus gauvreauii TaxID=438033 RepID=UPI003984134C